MSDYFNPERRTGDQAEWQRLKVHHDQVLRHRVEDALQLALEEGQSRISAIHLLGRILRLETVFMFESPVEIVNNYIKRHEQMCPNYLQEYQQQISSWPNEINPTNLLVRLLAILVDISHQGRIKLLDTVLLGNTVEESTNFSIQFLKGRVSVDEDTQEMEPFDMGAYLLADEERPARKARVLSLEDTQPFRPLR